eukprot:1204710-Rhodomonas_salina.2
MQQKQRADRSLEACSLVDLLTSRCCLLTATTRSIARSSTCRMTASSAPTTATSGSSSTPSIRLSQLSEQPVEGK